MARGIRARRSREAGISGNLGGAHHGNQSQPLSWASAPFATSPEMACPARSVRRPASQTNRDPTAAIATFSSRQGLPGGALAIPLSEASRNIGRRTSNATRWCVPPPICSLGGEVSPVPVWTIAQDDNASPSSSVPRSIRFSSNRLDWSSAPSFAFATRHCLTLDSRVTSMLASRAATKELCPRRPRVTSLPLW